jgi:hypothetical protein
LIPSSEGSQLIRITSPTLTNYSIRWSTWKERAHQDGEVARHPCKDVRNQDQIVISILLTDLPFAVLHGYYYSGPSTIVDDIGKDLNVVNLAEPSIDIDALCADVVDEIVVHLSSFAYVLNVVSLVIAAVNTVIRYLEIRSVPNA